MNFSPQSVKEACIREALARTGLPTRPRSATIVGVGSVGSFVALGLSKMGFNLLLLDVDFVEIHNMANQLYGVDSFLARTAYKTNELRKLLEGVGLSPRIRAVGHQVNRWNRFPLAQPLSEVFVTATDSMESRRNIWEGVQRQRRHFASPLLYVDVRMGRDGVQMYTAVSSVPRAFSRYERTLQYTDAEAHAAGTGLPCGEQASIVQPLRAAAIVTQAVREFYLWQQDRRRVRPCYSYTMYDDPPRIVAWR